MNDWNDRLYRPASSPGAHLDDAELLESDRSRAADKHIADCGWCKRRAALAAPDHDFDRLLAQLDAAPIDTVLQAARMWQMPATLGALLDSEEPAPAVAGSQLWSLSWKGRTCLAAVLQTHGWWAKVAPMTTDVDLADEYALLHDPASTALGQATVTFIRARATVPIVVFDQFLGDISIDGADFTDLATQTELALRSNETVVHGRAGRELAETDIDRLEALEALQEEMTWFESAVTDVVDSDGNLLGYSSDGEAVGDPGPWV